MTTERHSNIAVIGNSDLTNLLRLAGISRYTVIEYSETTESDVREALEGLLEKPDVSIIAIQSDYVKYVREEVERVMEDKSLTPVIIEIPSKSEGKEDTAGYYRTFVRKFVGFDIEI